MAPIKVILLACGSFNPPTNMHLRIFEVARDNLNRLGQYLVIGGIVSPVHDAYGKKDLIPASHRCEMLKLALQSSDWIKISNWECSQETWTTTRQVLHYHQNTLNSLLNNECRQVENVNHIYENNDETLNSWITNDIRNANGPIEVKLLCGADLLQSFGVPGLWAETDIETIIRQHGLVVISRQGYDPYHFIYESDILTRYQNNIIVVNEWVTNEISSTKIRRALRRHESVKYLVEEKVIDYIKMHGFYGCPKNDVKYPYTSNINENLTIPCIDDFILTPSPSDINMRSVNGSGENIFLELNAIAKAPRTDGKSDSQNKRGKAEEVKSFQSHTDIILGDGSYRKKTEKINYSDFHCEDDSAALTVGTAEPKKVGFIDEATAIDGNNLNVLLVKKCKNEAATGKNYISSPEHNNIRNQSIPSDGNSLDKSPKQMKKSLRCKPVLDSKKSSTFDKSDVSENLNSKSNVPLRRSNSDATMSRRTGAEAVSVKIHFTKEGIKVISDKESIV